MHEVRPKNCVSPTNITAPCLLDSGIVVPVAVGTHSTAKVSFHLPPYMCGKESRIEKF